MTGTEAAMIKTAAFCWRWFCEGLAISAPALIDWCEG
jgi:hypothetical protein